MKKRTLQSILFIFGAWSLQAAEYLPIGGISHVGFRVADLDKTRAFYTDVLGYQQAFDQKDESGKVTLSVFKINEDQFLEFSPGIPEGTTDRFTHIAFLTGKIGDLRQSIERLSLNPAEMRTGRDRTRNFSVRDPEGHRVEFVQYELDSLQAQARGKFFDDRRVSARLDRLGLAVADRAKAIEFFHGSLQFVEMKPGVLLPSRQVADAIELLPKGRASKLVFEVPDLKTAMKTLRARGVVATAGIKDPDGTPIEFVQTVVPKPAGAPR